MLRAVIDTNVLFEGLSTKGDCGDIIDAWAARSFTPCVSTALAYEYEDVLGRKFAPTRRSQVLAALKALLGRVEWVPIYTRVRPLSPDPDDDFVIECAYNSRAVIVTSNLKDLQVAESHLGIPVKTPAQFHNLLKD